MSKAKSMKLNSINSCLKCIVNDKCECIIMSVISVYGASFCGSRLSTVVTEILTECSQKQNRSVSMLYYQNDNFEYCKFRKIHIVDFM